MLGPAVAMRSYRLTFASQLWVSHGMFGYLLRRLVLLPLPVVEEALAVGGEGGCLVVVEACLGRPRMLLTSVCSVLSILSIHGSPSTPGSHSLVA